ncbi:MAG TPA: autotransporter outer membrane beta-barrel domain-containing protein, partial [Caulobacteraceae bacterium]|nr:autotransporter outer membrane beta-barrel domain-containing protein [Caulobacteraceae bacterium]
GIWYTTTQTWFDRQADLRDGLDARADGSKPAVWLKIIGDWTSRNASRSLTLGSQTYTYNTSYNQDSSAIIGGVDLLDVTSKDKAFVVGLEGGEVDSDMRFKATPDRFKITGGDFGGYASYLQGGLFIDGTINANFLKLNGDIVGLGGPPNTSAPTLTGSRVNSVGGQVEAGYQMPLSGSFFWEPVGSLSYVDASFDSIQLPGTASVAIGHAQSFRGSLGARVGGEQDFQYYKIKLALTARVWDEFDGNTISDVAAPAGLDFINNDNLKGVFGQISGEANLFTTTSGLSAFLNGGWKFKSNYSEGTITLGARYQW